MKGRVESVRRLLRREEFHPKQRGRVGARCSTGQAREQKQSEGPRRGRHTPAKGVESTRNDVGNPCGAKQEERQCAWPKLLGEPFGAVGPDRHAGAKRRAVEG